MAVPTCPKPIFTTQPFEASMKIKFIPDPPCLAITLSNGCNIFQDKHPQTNDPVTEANHLDVAEACVSPDTWSDYLKLQGVEIDGVMCSATKNDQSGLTAVLTAYQIAGAAFEPTRFRFENGNILVINKSNMKALIAAWMPFRQSFFAP